MATLLELTPVERELAECARRGRLLDLSLMPCNASKSIRAQVIVDLATDPIRAWRFWPFDAGKIRLKGATIIDGPPYFNGAKMARQIELLDCLIKERLDIPYRRTA